MVFSRFIWTVAGTVVTIVATAVLLGIFLQKPEYTITSSLLIILLALETAFLIWYMTRIRRDLLRLVLALRNEDPTLQFPRESRDPYFSAIHRGFNEIIRDFRLVRLDREAEHRFFEATVNHIRFGIIAFDRDGNVEIVNDAFLELFRQKQMAQIESLVSVHPELPELLRKLSGEKESLKKITMGGIPYHLIFLTSRFRIRGREITLVSVRDISREIDRNELEAWQKLMRVLRHEILNSVTPIRLISSNLYKLLQGQGGPVPIDSLTEGEISDIRTGLDTIHRRASGLSEFLDAYSNLYRVPELELRPARVCDLLTRISTLFSGQFEREKIGCRIDCEDKNLSVRMDAGMVEQVLINLVKNAAEAVHGSDHPLIILAGQENGDQVTITVKDNGPGIPEEQLDHIFIPFYTTREKGSGIGLSFSQHIMRLHQGRISVRSRPGEGSEFQLVFRTT